MICQRETQPCCVFTRVKASGSEFFAHEKDLMGSSTYGVGLPDWICRAPEHCMYAGTGRKAGDRIPQLIGWEFHGPKLKEDPRVQRITRNLFERIRQARGEGNQRLTHDA